MNCAGCRGACCEVITLPHFAGKGVFTQDSNRWLELHGRPVQIENVFGQTAPGVELEVVCRELTPGGQCGIYGEDNRPIACQVYPAGGKDCRSVVKRRRNRAWYESMVRESGDPTWEELDVE